MCGRAVNLARASARRTQRAQGGHVKGTVHSDCWAPAHLVTIACPSCPAGEDSPRYQGDVPGHAYRMFRDISMFEQLS